MVKIAKKDFSSSIWKKAPERPAGPEEHADLDSASSCAIPAGSRSEMMQGLGDHGSEKG
jgi:hypothetical protein